MGSRLKGKGFVDIREDLILRWFGCDCSESERCSSFNLKTYERYCNKCSTKLKGKWFDDSGNEVKQTHFLVSEVSSAVDWLKDAIEMVKVYNESIGIIDLIDEAFEDVVKKGNSPEFYSTYIIEVVPASLIKKGDKILYGQYPVTFKGFTDGGRRALLLLDKQLDNTPIKVNRWGTYYKIISEVG